MFYSPLEEMSNISADIAKYLVDKQKQQEPLHHNQSRNQGKIRVILPSEMILIVRRTTHRATLAVHNKNNKMLDDLLGMKTTKCITMSVSHRHIKVRVTG
jgi:hypothetical protein